MVRRWKKKGSLNLSIEAIVIVVIAFVVLGLGLGFVRSQFGSIEETAGSVQEQIKQQILDDLRTGNKKLSFPATSLTVERGQAKDIAVGVKNTGNLDLIYSVDVVVLNKQSETLTAEELSAAVEFFYDPSPKQLPPTESRVESIRISAPGATGTYLVKLSLLEGSDVYDEKTFFVTVI
jgi:hypothetical protein